VHETEADAAAACPRDGSLVAAWAGEPCLIVGDRAHHVREGATVKAWESFGARMRHGIVSVLLLAALTLAAAGTVRAQEAAAVEPAAATAAALEPSSPRALEPAAPAVTATNTAPVAAAAPPPAAAPLTLEDRAVDAAVAAHPKEAAIAWAASPELRATCYAHAHPVALSAVMREAHAWARANWAAMIFVSTHCRLLDGRERMAERIAGHRPSQWEIECEAGYRRPAGATAQLVEIWMSKFGDMPDAEATWTSWETEWWPSLTAAGVAAAAADAKQCAAYTHARAVLDAAIDRETAKLTAAGE
jgi:hypothetical protein